MASALVSALAIFFSGQHLQGYKVLSVKVAPPQELKYFHFGYRLSAADSIWLRLLQDFDYCEKKTSVQVGLVACERSWVFQNLLLIIELDPIFKMPYILGGVVLSVLVNDKSGASEIFRRGLKQYPDDWALAYRAGYHFMVEEQDSITAAKYFALAAENGGPSWLPSLVARLYEKGGEKEVAASILNDLLKQAEESGNEAIADSFRKRLSAIRSQSRN